MKLEELSHGIITLGACVILYYFNASPTSYLLPTLFFAGREHAQAEYRWIEHFGKGKRENLTRFGALDPKVWDTHSFWWNLMLPVIVSLSYLTFAKQPL